jgi:V/A-type H+-transporting ATPase subunit E
MYKKGESSMTGADKLKEKILEEARQQAKNNIERARQEAAGISNMALNEAEKRRREIIEKSRIGAAEREKRLISNAELEARNQRLKAKQEVVEEAFEKAIARLKELPSDQYVNILADMIVRAVSTGDEELILSKEDKNRIGNGIVKVVNERLKATKIKGNLRLADETRDIQGGFIVKSGDIEINNSLEAIIRMRRDKLEAEVVKTLFGEGD